MTSIPINFDFGRRWSEVIPHLDSNEIRTRLEQCWKEMTLAQVCYQADKYHHDKSPASQLTHCDGSHRIIVDAVNTAIELNDPRVPGGKRKQFERVEKALGLCFQSNPSHIVHWTSAYGSCHWYNRLISYYLAQKVCPEIEWNIIKSTKHTTVLSKDGTCMFDLLAWGWSSRLNAIVEEKTWVEKDETLGGAEAMEVIETSMVERPLEIPGSVAWMYYNFLSNWDLIYLLLQKESIQDLLELAMQKWCEKELTTVSNWKRGGSLRGYQKPSNQEYPCNLAFKKMDQYINIMNIDVNLDEEEEEDSDNGDDHQLTWLDINNLFTKNGTYESMILIDGANYFDQVNAELATLLFPDEHIELVETKQDKYVVIPSRHIIFDFHRFYHWATGGYDQEYDTKFMMYEALTNWIKPVGAKGLVKQWVYGMWIATNY